MKSIKILVCSLLLALSLGASAQNKFINDQLDNNAQNNGAKTVNVADIREVELVGTTVVIYKKNGTTDNWQGGWTIFDRFVSSPRNQGGDFVYYQVPSSGIHRKISYGAIAETRCDHVGGANPYQITIKFDVESGSGTLTAVLYSSSICTNFN